jgi:hypothetical protein
MRRAAFVGPPGIDQVVDLPAFSCIHQLERIYSAVAQAPVIIKQVGSPYGSQLPVDFHHIKHNPFIQGAGKFFSDSLDEGVDALLPGFAESLLFRYSLHDSIRQE